MEMTRARGRLLSTMPMSWENLASVRSSLECATVEKGKSGSYLVVIEPRSVVVKRDKGALMTAERRRLCSDMPDFAATETRTNLAS
jgi:hypothetical protein